MTAAGAAGVHGHPAMEEQSQGVESVTTQHPAMEAWRAQDCSKSRLNAFKDLLKTSDVNADAKIIKNL